LIAIRFWEDPFTSENKTSLVTLKGTKIYEVTGFASDKRVLSVKNISLEIKTVETGCWTQLRRETVRYEYDDPDRTV
jgi:hypothetical protein